MIRIGLMALLSGFLLACTPTYNWREVALADGAVQALFPDKPITQERPLNYAGHELRFSLSTAAVDGAVFAVGYAALPEGLRSAPEKPRELAASVVASLYRSLGAEPPAQPPAMGAPFVIEGKSQQGPVRMRARVWLTDHALIEGIVTADQASFPEQQADEFLRGLQVAR
ncbi:MAG: hypothetical protein ACTS5Y_00280 [Pollutimonas bauzanensis]|uniref:Lipoprotein n=2 Tax=Pollutimonas bauzanensis TaxID=658167 RepID=A0A1M5TJ61_9BURK|nr:hypothetical protein SAMN04488135_103398 [Pollutimonas bauzanensis]